MTAARYALFACLLGVLTPCPSNADAGAAPAAVPVRAGDIDWTHAQRYDIALGEFHFAPPRIVFQHGQPYALKLVNNGRFRHTFTAPAFFRSVVFGPGGGASEAEASGGISLGAGETAEVEFVPLRTGTFALECTKPLHGLFGMSGDILVQ